MSTDRLRTAAGRAAHWRWHGEQVCPADVGQECTVAGHIQSIEEEAYDEGWRADIGSNGPKAAAEPAATMTIEPAPSLVLADETAAAEPPLPKHVREELENPPGTTIFRPGELRAAQPPRGSHDGS